MDVAVVVGRPLQDLPVFVAVAARDLDEARRLEDEVALRPVRHEAVRRPTRDDDVVAVLVRHVPEGRLDGATSLVDEDHLVAFAVSEEVVHRAVRPAERDLDVVVPHERPTSRDLVALGRNVVRVLKPVRVGLGNPLLAHDRRERAELLDAAGRLEVVEDRLVPCEALEAHDLLGQEPPVLAEDDVALARELSAPLVEGHVRPFRVACSDPVTRVRQDGGQAAPVPLGAACLKRRARRPERAPRRRPARDRSCCPRCRSPSRTTPCREPAADRPPGLPAP